MHSSYLCKIYIHIISVLFVCCQEFVQQNHQNSYNRRIIRPNSEHSHKQQLLQQNAKFAGRAHPRPNTIGFEDTTQRPPERLTPKELTSHSRQQMPYESNDPHLRATKPRQQLMSHLSHGRQDSNEMPYDLTPKYLQNSNTFNTRPSIHPEIIANRRNLRIQSPLERDEEYDDGMQNIDQNNQLRNSPNNPRDRDSHNFDFNDRDNIANHDPRQPYPLFNQPFNQDRQNFFTSQDPHSLGMKVVVPRDETRVETRGGFESFSTKHDHKEFDKMYPKFDRNAHDSHLKSNEEPFNEIESEEPSNDYGDSPEREVKLQRNLNLYPPVGAEEEIRRFTEPFERPPPLSRHTPPMQRLRQRKIPDYLRNEFQKSDPNDFYSAQNQQNQNKANLENSDNFEQNIEHNPPFDSISDGPNGQTIFRDNNPNGFDFPRNKVNKHKNRFQQFYENDIQRQTSQKPNQIHNTYGRPVKKEIAIVREITEILPSDEEQSNNQHFDSPPIATPSPPDPPNDYFPFDENIEKIHEKPKKEKNAIDLGKEEGFYDDEEERLLLGQKSKDMDSDEEDDKEKGKGKSKFEKEVDLSADDLETYFDKEFANENDRDEEAQKTIVFDDEPKESNQVSKKEKSEEAEDVDVEADYKTGADFVKNHDDFLTKIDKENDKFRKRTENKVEKEGEDEETENETEQKTTVDDGEKELDGETEKKDGEEETEDKDKSDQKTNKEDKGVTEEEEVNDSNEENKDKKGTETEAEDDQESETKEVTEKEDQKGSDNNEDNQQNEEKNEEQEGDKTTKDEEKGDNTESDETNESNGEKETKSDKCSESNCDKELLKEESKESKNTHQLKSKQEGTEQVVEQNTSQQRSVPENSTAIETKPIESKPNRSLRISQTHNFAPFFIDLKRINPHKSNIRKGSENNESQTSWTTSATISPESSSSPKQRNTSIHSVSPPPESRDANKGKSTDNNKTFGTKRVVNSIKDIIQSQNRR